MIRPGETEDEWRDRMARRAEEQRYFTRLERWQNEALYSAPSRATTTAQVGLAAKPGKGAQPPRVLAPRPNPDSASWKACASCGRTMRPNKAKAADFPGTTVYGARGQCHDCTYRADRPKKVVRPKDCSICGKVMRKSTQTVAEVPGSVTHGKGDKCQGCIRKAERRAAREKAS